MIKQLFFLILLSVNVEQNYPEADSTTVKFTETPNITYTAHSKAEVRWGTLLQGEYSVILKAENKTQIINAIKGSGNSYRVVIPIFKNRIYTYIINCAGDDGKNYYSPSFELDTRMNYRLHSFKELNPESRSAKLAEPEFLKFSGLKAGYCFIYNIKSANYALAVIRHSQMNVIAVTSDEKLYKQIRNDLYKLHILGSRVSIFFVKRGDSLPFISDSMNLVVAETPKSFADKKTLSECYRILVPGSRGFFFLSPGNSANLAGILKQLQRSISQKSKKNCVIRKKVPKNSGSWTHQYGTTGNSASSTATLGNITSRSNLQVKWFGRPGADFGMDRNSRVPAPLALNGRLFHQGLNRFLAIDSYNGSPIWQIELPYLRKLNMLRDSSNWCIDNKGLYVTLNNKLMKFNPETGNILFTEKIPVQNPDRYDWGYLAASDSLIYGSAVLKKGIYKSFWGKKNWFDNNKGGYGTEKVCSNELFALDQMSAKKVWSYKKGIIINSTLLLIDNMICFLENRSSNLKYSGRMKSTELQNRIFLTALDKKSGTILWSKKLDIILGNIITYMQAADKRVIITTSQSTDKKYHIYAFNLTGKQEWEQHFKWPAGDHSAYQQHPVVVGGSLFLAPYMISLDKGKTISSKVPRQEGCATYVGTKNSLFFRGKNREIAIWGIKDNKYSTFPKLRPSCWISILPANGMLLVPEGGGGCSCGGWLETSLGFSIKDK